MVTSNLDVPTIHETNGEHILEINWVNIFVHMWFIFLKKIKNNICITQINDNTLKETEQKQTLFSLKLFFNHDLEKWR